VREETLSEVTTRLRTAPIATASSPISMKLAALSQCRPPETAETIARRIARSASVAARLMKIGRACELVSATTEVALVTAVSSTADQPRFEITEAST
jgi:hypothetical protein